MRAVTQILRELVRIVHGIFSYYGPVLKNYRRLKRRAIRVDRRIIRKYISRHRERKLHIGCGENTARGWLNSDFEPTSNDIFHLDATNVFPFKENTFDYIFSEHMIEHVTFQKGFKMLSECHRVLRNNGKIRVSTPDLQFLIDLYRDKKSELQLEYIKWYTERFNKDAPYPYDTFVINSFVREWGHLFIYDEKTLRASMEEAGFTNIVRCELNESENKALRNLENEKRIPKGFLKLESFTLEGTKAG
jgi:predicted SAM-dependent methyltransferase